MIDLAIVIAFVVYAIGSGLRARSKASQNLQEYFLAGKTLKGWRAGFSMAATQFAADTPLLVTGLVATAGIFALWRLWIYALAFLLMAFVFSVCWRRGGVLTDAELTEVRYSGRGVLGLRVLKALYFGTVINCVVLAMVLVAAIRIAEVFLPWDAWLPGALYDPVVGFVQAVGLKLGDSLTGIPAEINTTNNLITILLILTFTAAYSTTGGLRAVVNTDVVQFFLAMIGTAIFAWAAVQAAGGLGGLSERVVEIYGSEEAARMLSFGPETAPDLLLPFLTIIGLQWFFQMNSDGTGYLAQRSMACRSDRDARIAGVIFTWAQIFFRSLLWLAIAVALLVVYPFTTEEAAGGEAFVASREMLFVTGIDELLPPGLRGLMLVGLLAALASTVDTHLNWGAGYWSNDIYDRLWCQHIRRREPKGRELVVVARLSNVLILGIALVVMANLGAIQTAWFISLLFGAGMGAVLVLRWLWERINLYSEFAAMAVSLITAPILLMIFGTAPESEWLRLGIMALVTTTAAIGITFVTPRTNPEVLLAFYERVQPFGWWRETAPMAGDRPEAPLRELGRRAVAIVATAASLFLLLVGVGRLMLSPPGINMLWTWVSIGAGLALVPVWLRYLLRDDLGIDRAMKADEPRSDRALIEEDQGLLPALQQLARHMRLVYGSTVEVGTRGAHRVEEVGKRVQIFQIVQDLLLFVAHRDRTAPVSVTLGRRDDVHFVELEFGGQGIPLECPPDWGYDLIENIRERLFQVEGRLEILPNAHAAQRVTIHVPTEAARQKQARAAE